MLVSEYYMLPFFMQNETVKKYYEMLSEKRLALALKRLFDIVFSLILIVLLSPLFIIISFLILVDSRGPIIYIQKRITKNYGEFKIIKFRTMYTKEGDDGNPLTVSDDARITKVGAGLRKYRLDEIPQLFNILMGTMTFVGTRPEVKEYVDRYTDEMKATLLLPAGLTSRASILFRNEAELLQSKQNVEEVYLAEILPSKMIHNLEYLRDFKFTNDILVLFQTLFMREE